MILSAVRTPPGRRGTGPPGVRPARLLGLVQRAAPEAAGADPAPVGQVVGGCIEPDMSKVNPNSGAIALGHPLGGTGTLLERR